ncbi:hypothetical protein F5144DRAFT_564954 [Chaetomium tenue]|uniref:Uncharacterized protein n=1 Tax=Chaetomium tenue TaxID=1854479 RepID=A0ACB7PIN0_9PEZI|nr:hypothetical protein F5144DRAFT_564954 [Chaetomium globosum]
MGGWVPEEAGQGRSSDFLHPSCWCLVFSVFASCLLLAAWCLLPLRRHASGSRVGVYCGRGIGRWVEAVHGGLCEVVGGGVFEVWLVSRGFLGWSSDMLRLVAVLDCLLLLRSIKDMATGLKGLSKWRIARSFSAIIATNPRESHARVDCSWAL